MWYNGSDEVMGMGEEMCAELPRKRANIYGIVGFLLAVGGVAVFIVLFMLAIMAVRDGQWPYLVIALVFVLPLCSTVSFAGAIVAGVGLGRMEGKRLNGLSVAGFIVGVLFGLPALLFWVLMIFGLI